MNFWEGIVTNNNAVSLLSKDADYIIHLAIVRRDFINVIDIARGVIDLLENEKSNGGIINLGYGAGTSENEIT